MKESKIVNKLTKKHKGISKCLIKEIVKETVREMKAARTETTEEDWAKIASAGT